jgi:hypothetical protein
MKKTGPGMEILTRMLIKIIKGEKIKRAGKEASISEQRLSIKTKCN